jgi:hypothetical protein
MNSKTVTSTLSFFASTDVGAVISGGGIPANSTITNFNSTISVTISVNATSTNSNETITITRMPTAATAGFAATSGTSGIIIDNVFSNSGTSQIYYETLGTTSAVQVAQGVL